MTKNSHDHSKREELGHSLEILGQSKRETQQGKNPNAATPCLMKLEVNFQLCCLQRLRPLWLTSHSARSSSWQTSYSSASSIIAGVSQAVQALLPQPDTVTSQGLHSGTPLLLSSTPEGVYKRVYCVTLKQEPCG